MTYKKTFYCYNKKDLYHLETKIQTFLERKKVEKWFPPFTATFAKIKESKTDKQNNTYWMLMDIIANWWCDNDPTYQYKKEQASIFFLQETGLTILKGNTVIPRCVSELTKEEMKMLIQNVSIYCLGCNIEIPDLTENTYELNNSF